MKLLIALSTLIALCAGNYIPLIPGDNSHYVRGESRFIWLTNGSEVPVLVDLEEPVDNARVNSLNGANNEYWLFTRSNPTSPQFIVFGEANTIANSYYDGNKPLKVLVHGWTRNGNHESMTVIRDAYLNTADVNVIIVDWSVVASGNYVIATLNVPSVGQFIGNFVIWLFNNAGGNWQSTHLIGFSLGAHAVGSAGRIAGSLPARVTGLDPAGPLWNINPNALKTTDGQYVEVIHTDGGVSGIYNPIGLTNFYPNGGKGRQPGCDTSSCDHNRAPQYFASSLYTNHFIGRRCDNLVQVENNQCNGSSLTMGNADLNKRGSGLYGLTTGAVWPY